jgi:hypothetical protein
MTQDEIIEMAEQAGVDEWWDSGNEQREVLQEHLEAFAKLVAAKEREACAKLCETGIDTEHPIIKGHIMKDFGASTHLADAIRARGQA